MLLLSCGVMMGALGFRSLALGAPSVVVVLALLMHDALMEAISVTTLFDAYILVTALQAGYLAWLATEMAVSHHVRLLRRMKLFAVALALATGAFLLTMLKDPPTSIASDPAAPPAPTPSPQVPSALP